MIQIRKSAQLLDLSAMAAVRGSEKGSPEQCSQGNLLS